MKMKMFIFPILTLCFLLCVVSPSRAWAPLRVHFIDVGYGDAIFIQFPDQSNALIDSGTAENADRLLRYLKDLPVAKIDRFILTHSHRDHFGGIKSISDHFPIGQIYFNGDTTRAHEGFQSVLGHIKEKGLTWKKLARGDILCEEQPAFGLEVLHPSELSSSANNNALVLLLRYEETAVLFFSDIGPREQEEVIAALKVIDNIQLVQLPHHGSDFSQGLLREFRDKIFVCSVGPNEYGIPDESELTKLKGAVYRTDVLGTIVFETDGKDLRMIK